MFTSLCSDNRFAAKTTGARNPFLRPGGFDRRLGTFCEHAAGLMVGCLSRE
jgi:hypothetical protein